MPGSTQVPDRSVFVFAYGTITRSGRLSHTFLLQTAFLSPNGQVLQPHTIARAVWAAPFSLATTQGMISFPPATEMFQFAGLPPHGLCVQPWVTGHDPSRVSPFGYPRILRLFTAPRGFSQ